MSLSVPVTKVLLYLACHLSDGPSASQYEAPIIHARPSPRKTLTEFDPVTLPTDASAYGSSVAAVIEANVSGSDVPSATKVIAVISSGTPQTHPKMAATSPTTAVQIPMKMSDTTKAA